eukprot:4260577-Pyramimonas_sp.AAC.1
MPVPCPTNTASDGDARRSRSARWVRGASAGASDSVSGSRFARLRGGEGPSACAQPPTTEATRSM